MSRKFILIGDSHSHGGQVIEGAPTARIGGKLIARLGDVAICQLHGRTQIASVSGKLNIEGREAAVEGDKLACGASLIGGSQAIASSGG